MIKGFPFPPKPTELSDVFFENYWFYSELEFPSLPTGLKSSSE